MKERTKEQLDVMFQKEKFIYDGKPDQIKVVAELPTPIGGFSYPPNHPSREPD